MSDETTPHPQNLIKANHVRQAAIRWKQERYGSFQNSKKYEVIIGKAQERFPPKAICALALEIATDGRITLKPSDFPGLKDGAWHKRLRNLGFKVVLKEGMPIADSEELSHCTSLLDAPDAFLAINVTNSTSELYNQNIALLEKNQIGYWAIPPAALEAPLGTQVVYLYFRSMPSGRNDIYRGVIRQVDLYPARRPGRDRYPLHIAAPGWKKIGESAKTFSSFFTGESVGTSPVCVWVKKKQIWNVGDTQSDVLKKDLAALVKRAKAGTNITTLVQARVGQGPYRKAVLKIWGGACAATGIALPAILRASHIKPWRSSTDEERLNPLNGLPLVATIDALFDCGLISFDSAGYLLCSSRLPMESCNDPAEPAQVKRLMRMPQPGFSYSAPGVDDAGCKRQSSRQSRDWRVARFRSDVCVRIAL